MKVVVNGERVVKTGEGVGPVHALDQALRECLAETPTLRSTDLHLVDYRVRVLDSNESTGAKVRVLVGNSRP